MSSNFLFDQIFFPQRQANCLFGETKETHSTSIVFVCLELDISKSATCDLVFVHLFPNIFCIISAIKLYPTQSGLRE